MLGAVAYGNQSELAPAMEQPKPWIEYSQLRSPTERFDSRANAAGLLSRAEQLRARIVQQFSLPSTRVRKLLAEGSSKSFQSRRGLDSAGHARSTRHRCGECWPASASVLANDRPYGRARAVRNVAQRSVVSSVIAATISARCGRWQVRQTGDM